MKLRATLVVLQDMEGKYQSSNAVGAPGKAEDLEMSDEAGEGSIQVIALPVPLGSVGPACF
jgi:hypothetical protein